MEWFFDDSDFVVRNHCGPGWTQGLILVNQFANFVIFIAYISLSIFMFNFWIKNKRNMPSSFILLLFSVFIFFCGLTHMCEIIVFYMPMYRFFTMISVITSFVSFLTCLLYPKFMYEWNKQSPREYIDRLNTDLTDLSVRRKEENVELEQRNKSLITRISILEGMLNDNAWIQDKESALAQLRAMLQTIGDKSHGG